MAGAGASHTPCFWLRGLPPTSWTTPPPCETPDTEERFGELDRAPIEAPLGLPHQHLRGRQRRRGVRRLSMPQVWLGMGRT
eukprot:5651266-Pyramimonas_sp.AAC.1